MTLEIEPEFRARLERLLGELSGWSPVDRGYTSARRGLVTLHDGRRVFVKAASEELSARWLRAEHHVYSHIAGSCLPTVLGWDGDGPLPILVLEDLSSGFCVPPWTIERVESVRLAIKEIAGIEPPPGLPTVADHGWQETGWQIVMEDPAPFLSLGLCRAPWLDRSLPVLLAAVQDLELGGDVLVHCDIRSDNITFRGEQAVFVDWNWAAVGNPLFDLAAWLPSLAVEGGPAPAELLSGTREAAGFAALLAGVWAARAALPPPPTSTIAVRHVQRAQLRVALSWAVRELDLPDPSDP